MDVICDEIAKITKQSSTATAVIHNPQTLLKPISGNILENKKTSE